ncbi:hypothetical protein HQ496_09840 [bacterium]|nr:hypothetical protein [bacterium]
MITKWILLLVIAWYVSKAVGNVILSLRGAPPVQSNPLEREAESKVHVHKNGPANTSSVNPKEVEDARFVDL